MVGGWPSTEGLRPSDYIDAELWCCFVERRAEWMLTIEGLIAVISLCVGCFSLGYAIGSKDNHKMQK